MYTNVLYLWCAMRCMCLQVCTIHLCICVYTYSYNVLPLHQLLKVVDQEQAQQMTDQYSSKVKEFDKKWEEFDRRSNVDMPSDIDWQKEVEMEQNMRLVADMQMALQREIK